MAWCQQVTHHWPYLNMLIKRWHKHVRMNVETRPILPTLINKLAPGKFDRNFRYVIFKQILVIAGWGISCEIALIWMSLDFTDDQSTLVQVMAWCRQAASHYLSQCWSRSLSPYDITRPQWVNKLRPEQNDILQKIFSNAVSSMKIVG